jgi:hypothetical protein
MAFLAMAFLWTGSQIPVYFYGGISAYVYKDIGGHDRWTWFVRMINSKDLEIR